MPTGPPAVPVGAPDSPAWPAARWAQMLDRMELRQDGVGMRFWAPPLFLEVTMSGPDSDLWPHVSDDREWNWQSSAPCTAATRLADAGGADGPILAVISRYTIENLILNAVHEIGEWLRVDGRRLFPAHLPPGDDGENHPESPDVDGNGAVRLEVGFSGAGRVGDRPVTFEPPLDDQSLDVVGDLVAPARFTYLPNTSISYSPAGPVVTRHDRDRTVWCSGWSDAVTEGTGGAGTTGLVEAVAQDVHRAVVEYEADRICRAFLVDGRPGWTLAPRHPQRRPGGRDSGADGLSRVSIGIAYASGATDGIAPRILRPPSGAGGGRLLAGSNRT